MAENAHVTHCILQNAKLNGLYSALQCMDPSLKQKTTSADLKIHLHNLSGIVVEFRQAQFPFGDISGQKTKTFSGKLFINWLTLSDEDYFEVNYYPWAKKIVLTTYKGPSGCLMIDSYSFLE